MKLLSLLLLLVALLTTAGAEDGIEKAAFYLCVRNAQDARVFDCYHLKQGGLLSSYNQHTGERKSRQLSQDEVFHLCLDLVAAGLFSLPSNDKRFDTSGPLEVQVTAGMGTRTLRYYFDNSYYRDGKKVDPIVAALVPVVGKFLPETRPAPPPAGKK